MSTEVPSTGAQANSRSHHLYVHVPFCRLVCAYCDFVTVGGRGADIPRYVDALLAELGQRPAPGRLATIYFGGGTPSLLPPAAVARVIEAAEGRWGATPDEITLEANPSLREAPDWGALRQAGVNRISLGVQSLRDGDLRALARGHTAGEPRAAYAAARAAGFENVSLDLIYAIPGQDLEAWRGVVAEAVALQPEHLSLYALQLALAPDEWAAPPRAGALRWRARAAALQDDDVAADQYRVAEDMLAGAGYRHYELSSWSQPGRESRHNAAYWARRPYTGIGAGAHSYDGGDYRSWNVRDLDTYLASVEAGRLPRAGHERLDPSTRAFEAVALGLRRVDGLERQAFAAEFGSDPAAYFAGAVEETVAYGLVELDPRRIRLSAAGRLLASQALLAFMDGAAQA
ncbi:MAG TPA: radical SAM family heme chaperone HemW [Candidatus Limnocylindria bacterium]|nr:radical SAM family heme chaperone HemW [Candidatus Limnocylindria bacterium]